MGHQPFNVIVVGDLMLDKYIIGDSDRISPEAPVPIVRVNDAHFTLGGAGNVVHNLVNLGAKVSIHGVINSDAAGMMIEDKMNAMGVRNRIIIDDSRITTLKTRLVSRGQQIARIDFETPDPIHPDIENIMLSNILSDMFENEKFILLISDYNKGVVTHSLAESIIKFANGFRKGMTSNVIVDPKGKDFSKYFGAGIITPNKKEAEIATGIEIKGDKDLIRASHKISDDHSIGTVIITVGSKGAFVYQKMHDFERSFNKLIPGYKHGLADVSGAGDAFVATLAMMHNNGWDIESSVSFANKAGGIVVTKPGTVPITLEELNSIG